MFVAGSRENVQPFGRKDDHPPGSWQRFASPDLQNEEGPDGRQRRRLGRR